MRVGQKNVKSEYCSSNCVHLDVTSFIAIAYLDFINIINIILIGTSLPKHILNFYQMKIFYEIWIQKISTEVYVTTVTTWSGSFGALPPKMTCLRTHAFWQWIQRRKCGEVMQIQDPRMKSSSDESLKSRL